MKNHATFDVTQLCFFQDVFLLAMERTFDKTVIMIHCRGQIPPLTYITDTYIPTPALDAPFVTSPRHQKKTRARNPWLTPTDGGRCCTSFQGVGLLHLFSSCNLAFFLLAKFRTSQTAFFLRRGNPLSRFRVFSTCLLGLCLYNAYRNKAVFRKAIQKKPLHNYAGFNQSSSRTSPHPWYVQWYQYSA